MIDDPVVETINAILNGEDNFILLLQRPQLERIRDEIVALRERLREQNAISVTLENAHAATRMARDEALEEAARIAESDEFCDPVTGWGMRASASPPRSAS